MNEFELFCQQNEQHREEAEERAAIMEYHGHLDREAAERETVRRIRWKYGIMKQGEMF